ncbi:MAG: MAPEG family protein [Halioglobus sp.]
MEVMNTGLALPMATTLLLTLVVWITLFVRRVVYMSAHNVDVEQMKTPADTQALISGDASAPSNNFKNLLEVPVVFYAVCLYLTVFGMVDSLHVTCAWIFVVGRILHSLIHCSYNRVMHRFVAYFLSSLAVWLMVLRAFIATV